MKADLPLREPATQSHWEKIHLYKKMQDRSTENKSPAFVLHDGPPYANGAIHVGHALNKILKDVIVKYKAMKGFRAPYIPGWDCHGLPIEHQLMKEKGWDKRKVGRLAFRQEATRYAEHWIDLQRRDFKRLGVLADWDHPYKTLAPEYEAAVAETFYKLFEAGGVVQDKKPVHWCPSCETALAEAEIEYENKTSPSIFVKFPITEWPANEDAQSLAKAPGKKPTVLVWTTTPWTLPANVALAFHPDHTYRLWESAKTGERFLVGDPGLAVLEEVLGPGKAVAVEVLGESLEGLVAKNPINNNDSQGVLAKFVSNTDGSGVVHIAPGHGEEDYVVGRSYGLPVLSPVDDAGRFSPDVLPNDLAGKTVWEANPLIIERLTKSLLLLKTAPVAHSYPHCWRCKNPILFRAALQWFLKVTEEFRAQLIESTERVRWIPDYGKERILGMLKSRPDWCLSRQRYWGTPIPMFACVKCNEPLKDKKVFAAVVEAFRQKGGDVWYEKDPAFFGVQGPCAKCGGTAFKKEEDILDVWFDSGVSWAAVINGRPETHGTPRADVMYLEGSDQHRGWFQTSLLPSVRLTGEPPYGQVLTHGFVLDGQGRAMSKSLGNVIAPQTLIEKYGADVLRLWVAVTDYREDVRLSQDILDRVIDTYRKIRNTLRFLLGNLGDFVPAQHAVAFNKMEPLDLAALTGLKKLIDQTTAHYDQSEFHQVAGALADQFCINTLSEYYLDVRKDILYCDLADSPRRRSAQTAFWHIARALAKLLAPILSFTAEETWQTLREQNLLDASDNPESVFLNSFPVGPEISPTPTIAEFLSVRRLINEAVEKARQAGTLKGANDALIVLKIGDAGPDFKKHVKSDAELASVLGVAALRLEKGDGGPTVESVSLAPGAKCPRCWLWRPLGGRGLCERCDAAEPQTAAAPAPR
ncbi:MAG: isoleucine--tRNA ligase [Elusimicrobia bacterium]|nr:isoleucine--tRNA ligase [Elusimicrobiota bacterium]